MSFRLSIGLPAALLALLALWVGGLAGTAQAQEDAVAVAPPKAKALKQVRVWTYVGPRGYLSNAKVVLKDRTGRTIKSGYTGTRGTITFDLSKVKSLKTPLMLSSAGGNVVASLTAGNITLSRNFEGHLRAPVFDPTTRSGVVHLNLISTAASQLSTTQKGYAAAVAKVRRAIGFTKHTPHDALRLRNSYVGFKQLIVASRRAGGFDRFVEDVAEVAAARKKVAKLRPTSANQSGAVPARLIRAKKLKGIKGLQPRPATRQATAASTTICQVGVPNTGTTQSEVITDVAEVGIGTLMKVAGLPTTATNSITGMALGAIGVGSATTVQEQQAELVAADLDCLGEQMNYLSNQIAAVQLSVDLSATTPCTGKMDGTNAWEGYTYILSNQDSTLSNGAKNVNYFPIVKGDKEFEQNYLATWLDVYNTCGGIISDTLWGTKGGTGYAWNQLVSNTMGSSKWYTPQQVASLQTFLSYWGTMTYQQYILYNEYLNYYGSFRTAIQISGTTQDASGNMICNPANAYTGSSDVDKVFCVWRSAIMQAYPKTLYSDELGLTLNGLAVNAIPFGAFSPKPITNPPSGMAATQSKYRTTSAGTQDSYSATAGNIGWLFNYYLNMAPFDGSGAGNLLRFANFGGVPVCRSKYENPCPGPQTTSESNNFAWDAAGYFNGKGINPKKYGSAIQTFDNPQATPRYPNNATGGGLACSDVSDLTTSNNGVSATTALYNAVNQAPNGGNGPWSTLKSTDIAYFVNEWQTWWEVAISSSYGVMYGTVKWNPCLGNANSGGAAWALSSFPNKPVFATMLSRAWWSGAATAKTFTPYGQPVIQN